MNSLALVADWHQKFGVVISETPYFDPSLCELRIALLLEEKDELQAAMHQWDRVEILDALCDLQYVLSGAIVTLGLQSLMNPIAPPPAKKFGVEDREGLHAMTTLLSIRIKRLGRALSHKDVSQSVFHIVSIQSTLNNLITESGFGDVFADAFLAVHENNMAKVWEDWHVAELVDGFGIVECAWKKDHYIVFNDMGKILKPPGFTKVSLAGFVK